MHLAGSAAPIDELVKKLGLPRSSKQRVADALGTLFQQGYVFSDAKNRYSLSKKLVLVEALLEKNARGFGFGTKLKVTSGKQPWDRDPFISASRLGNARHGDRVLLRIIKVRKDGRPEAEVVSVLKRSSAMLGGILSSGKRSRHRLSR